MRVLWLVLVCLLAAVGAGPVAQSAVEPDGQTTWYVILAADGQQIGHSRQTVVESPKGRQVVQEQEILLQEKRSPMTRMITRTVTLFDAAGRARSIKVSSSAGKSWSRHEAVIEGGRARITRETPTDRRVVTLTLPPGIRFDSGDGLLQGWDPAVTPSVVFDSLDVDGMAVDRVVLTPVPGAAAPQGGRVLLRRRYEGNQLQSVARLTLDADGRLTEMVQPMFGTRIVLRPASRETALAPHAPYRAVPSMMTKSLFRISPPALRGHIRYRFGFKDDISFDLPSTGEQRVKVIDGVATVDICAACGPGLPTDAAYLADALRPTAWLQSDHRRLKAIADPIARMPVSETRKMELLIRKAAPYLNRIDFAGHYSALDTLDRRAGDCTEAAVLLAALGRSAGIPTRVVNGLVYSRERYHGVSNAFLPHSWTLAYVDGAWRSFDLALSDFDSTHLALSVSDGDERSLAAAGQLASLLDWQAMAEVRSRP